MSKVFIIDNYDSFTFNLVHLVKDLHQGTLEVRRNDQFELDMVEEFDKILLSPGPGIPEEAGLMPDVVRQYGGNKSILGVCLGHQCIGEVFGAKLTNLSTVYHGKGMNTHICSQDELFADVPTSFMSGRYHSWVVDRAGLPKELVVTATDDQNLIMGIRHMELDVRGVQFHPESILTEHGATMIKNWLSL
ncbi:MAG: aminodeoxychorismate/anthranilate synthase component II [Bdellovibrionales bacterium]|nr:aminodeoxychorismate/anthranilate synthase component II [Bdellovibrionales bacterium]